MLSRPLNAYGFCGFNEGKRFVHILGGEPFPYGSSVHQVRACWQYGLAIHGFEIFVVFSKKYLPATLMKLVIRSFS